MSVNGMREGHIKDAHGENFASLVETFKMHGE